jgi:hypothetical protein
MTVCDITTPATTTCDVMTCDVMTCDVTICDMTTCDMTTCDVTSLLHYRPGNRKSSDYNYHCRNLRIQGHEIYKDLACCVLYLLISRILISRILILRILISRIRAALRSTHGCGNNVSDKRVSQASE